MLEAIFIIIKSSTRNKYSKPAIHTIHLHSSSSSYFSSHRFMGKISLNLELNYRFITFILPFRLLQVQVPVHNFRLKKFKLSIIFFRQYNLNLLLNLRKVLFTIFRWFLSWFFISNNNWFKFQQNDVLLRQQKDITLLSLI